MKGYSQSFGENCASARLEGVNASFKDLVQVCGNIRLKKADWAISFLEKASEGEVPVLYRSYNKKLGHRRELGGRKGRYPKKAAKIVLKVLLSAIANGEVKGIGSEFVIKHACANKKMIMPRIASKGRWARSNLETSRIEIIVEAKSLVESPKVKKVQIPQTIDVKPEIKVESKTDQKQEKQSSEKTNSRFKKEPKKKKADKKGDL